MTLFSYRASSGTESIGPRCLHCQPLCMKDIFHAHEKAEPPLRIYFGMVPQCTAGFEVCTWLVIRDLTPDDEIEVSFACHSISG